jgi:hypothetical protein
MKGYADEKIEEGLYGFKMLTLKSGRRITFYDAKSEAKGGMTRLWRSLRRMSQLARKPDADEEFDIDWEQIEWLLNDVEVMVGVWRKEVAKHSTTRSREERIAKLRNVIGRTPAETAAFQAKADQLERETA